MEAQQYDAPATIAVGMPRMRFGGVGEDLSSSSLPAISRSRAASVVSGMRTGVRCLAAAAIFVIVGVNIRSKNR